MTAYDLDGIFVSDLHITDNLEELLKFRVNNVKPLFEPDGDYYIITGRPIEDKEHTLKWIDTFFKNKPLKVFHDNDDWSKPNEYKLKVLKENLDVDTFFESELYQVEWINNNITHVKVHHFETFIRKAINEKRY